MLLANPTTVFHAVISECATCHQEHRGRAQRPINMRHAGLLGLAEPRMSAWISRIGLSWPLQGSVLDGSDDTPFDCGAVATALVNAAWSRGLGAVIISQGIMQSPVVREHAGIADDQVIMKSIALGWPDESFPANAVVSARKSVEEATVFVGFPDTA